MKIRKSELNALIAEAVDKALREGRGKRRSELLEAAVGNARAALNELSQDAMRKVVKALEEKGRKLDSAMLSVTPEKIEDYLKDKPEAVKRRYRRMQKEGTLTPHLNRQQHVINTIAQMGLEFFRSKYNIPISPQWTESAGGEAWGKGYTNASRKPTDEERAFYEFIHVYGGELKNVPEKLRNTPMYVKFATAWQDFALNEFGRF